MQEEEWGFCKNTECYSSYTAGNENRTVYYQHTSYTGDFKWVAYPGGLDLLVFIGNWHFGLLEDDKLGPCGIFQTFLEGGKNQQRMNLYASGQ